MKDFLDCPVCESKHSLDISNMRWVLDEGKPGVTDTRYLECGFDNWNADKHSYYQRPRMLLYFSKEQNRLLSYGFEYIKLPGRGLIERFGSGQLCSYYLPYVDPYGDKKVQEEYIESYIEFDLDLSFIESADKMLARLRKLKTFE